MTDVFKRYDPLNNRDGPILAAEVTQENAGVLSFAVDGDLIYEEVRGGSRVRRGFTMVDHFGDTVVVLVGDYVISVSSTHFVTVTKEFLDTKWILSPSKIR